MVVVVATGTPPSDDALNFHARAAITAAFCKSAGPDTARAEVTFPCSLIVTSTATAPPCRASLAADGYTGSTLFTAPPSTTPGDCRTALGGGSAGRVVPIGTPTGTPAGVPFSVPVRLSEPTAVRGGDGDGLSVTFTGSLAGCAGTGGSFLFASGSGLCR